MPHGRLRTDGAAAAGGSPAFSDAATAQQFVDADQPGVVGTFTVVTGCVD